MSNIAASLTVPVPTGSIDATTTVNGITIPAVYNIPALFPTIFKFGVGAAKVNLISKLYTGSVVGTTLDIDLANMLDGNGNSIVFARLKYFVLFNLAATAGYSFLVGAAAANPLVNLYNGSSTAKQLCYPGCLDANTALQPGKFELVAPDATGIVVAAAGARFLRIDSGANTIPYAYFAAGTDA